MSLYRALRSLPAGVKTGLIAEAQSAVLLTTLHTLTLPAGDFLQKFLWATDYADDDARLFMQPPLFHS